ncbi:MAG: zinc metallopeptidase [Lachnospiraceae bacterium]|nr:zinc metallopeptidase [Lachnospiraceae bacterium]
MFGYYGYSYYGTYWLILIGAVICLAASARMNHTFRRYSQVRSMSGMTGAEAAERILRNAGIYDVSVTHIRGNLTDHYNPKDRTLALSDSVYSQTSVAAIGVAAHECGHAIQHQQGYAPLRIRGALVPVVNLGSGLAWPVLIVGLIFGGAGSVLCQVGIWLFSLAVLFQLVTLPVEFNASRRALRELERTGILGGGEIRDTGRVLRAAAMTYVASVASTLLQLLRLVLIFGGGNRRR